MKRSEAIKEIVKKSYGARAAALNEVEKGRGFQDQDTVSAPSPSGAPANTGSIGGPAAGGSSGGGNSTQAVRVLPLRKALSKLKVGDIVLGFPEKIKKGDLSGLISAVAKDDADADILIAADADLEKAPIKETLPVEKAELEIVEDPFIEHEEKEEFILKESIDEEKLKEEIPHMAILINADGTPTTVHVGSGLNEKELEAMNEYEVKKADPKAEDLILVKDNNEALVSDYR